MQKQYLTKAEVLFAISEVSNIDYEETLKAFDYCFVTKDGKEYQTPNFHFFVKALIEHANAKLEIEECFELPWVTLLGFKKVETERQEDISDEEVKFEEQEVKKSRGRQTKK